MSSRSCSAARSVIFYLSGPCGASVVHSDDTAVQVADAGDFGQGCAGMFQDDLAHLLPLFCRKERFAPHAGVEVVDGSVGFPLVKQLLDKAKGNAEAVCPMCIASKRGVTGQEKLTFFSAQPLLHYPQVER